MSLVLQHQRHRSLELPLTERAVADLQLSDDPILKYFFIPQQNTEMCRNTEILLNAAK